MEGKGILKNRLRRAETERSATGWPVVTVLPAVPAAPAPTFFGELGKVLLQVRDALPLQVAVKLEPRDGLVLGEPGSRQQPAAADHLLQQPAAGWRHGRVGKMPQGPSQASLEAP